MLPTTPARRTAVAAATAALLLLSLSACAPASAGDPELESGSLDVSIAEWRQNMDDCMLDAGFDLTAQVSADGSSEAIDTSQFDMAEFDKAYAACTEQVGEAPVDESLPSEEELFDAQLLFAACMREAGYDYPDPVKGSGGLSPAFGPETDIEVVDACSAEAYADFGAE
ncbi:hypothetical protein [Microterricola pindariensis]|nr:hypothetical protein [Microterricola pindariensis]